MILIYSLSLPFLAHNFWRNGWPEGFWWCLHIADTCCLEAPPPRNDRQVTKLLQLKTQWCFFRDGSGFCNFSVEYSALCFWLCVVFSPPVRLENRGNHWKNTEKNIFLNILAVILYSNVKLTVLIWIFLETDVLSSSLSRFVYYYYYDDDDDDDDNDYYCCCYFQNKQSSQEI